MSSKTRTLYHRDNRTQRSGKRLEKLEKQIKELDRKEKTGTISTAWINDARGKALARAKKYGLKVQ